MPRIHRDGNANGNGNGNGNGNANGNGNGNGNGNANPRMYDWWMTPRCAVVALLVASGCAHEGGGAADANFADGLCTTAACVTAPCTAGCVYTMPADGMCPDAQPERVAESAVDACSPCGLFAPRHIGSAGYIYIGCVKYHSEMPQCGRVACGPPPQCFEFSPALDYYYAAGICPAGFQCWAPPYDDLAADCRDLAIGD